MGEITTDGTFEETPEWTAVAFANVSASVREQARALGAFEIVDVPAPTPEHARVLDEHCSLLTAVAASELHFTRKDSVWGNPDTWGAKATNIDYSIGPGLRFLREQTGADAGVFVFGASYTATRSRQGAALTVGVLLSALMPGAWMPVGAGGLMLAIVDLESGDLLWVHRVTLQSGGVDVTDFRNKPEVDAITTKLLAPYPGLERYERFRSRGPLHSSDSAWQVLQAPLEAARHDALRVDLPQGWFRHVHPVPDVTRDDILLTLDGTPLHYIRVATEKGSNLVPSPERLAEVGLSAARNDVTEREVVESRSVTVAGRSGVRLHLRYLDPLGVRYEEVRYGLEHAGRLHTFEYAAPAIHYFPRHLACFEEMVASVRVD